MRKNIGKGTDIFCFFGDFFKFVGEYYIPEVDENYWDKLIYDSNKLLEKYKTCDFYSFAKGMVLVYIAWLEEIHKGTCNDQWNIGFRQNDKEQEMKL